MIDYGFLVDGGLDVGNVVRMLVVVVVFVFVMVVLVYYVNLWLFCSVEGGLVILCIGVFWYVYDLLVLM